MFKYESMVEAVRDKIPTARDLDPALVVGGVINAVAQLLPPETRSELGAALPGSLRRIATPHTPVQLVEGEVLVRILGDRLGVPPERARYLAQAVLEEMQAEDPELTQTVFNELPKDVVDTLTPSGEPPDIAVSVEWGSPRRLTAEEVHSALRKLPEWSGDEHAITRTVGLPADRYDALHDQIERVAHRTLNEHASMSRSPDGLQITLRSARRYVTESDIALAQQINNIIAKFNPIG
jgi:pterin-4a-carbinolamine dehydratase/uncharacterized protein (DUF2267 family)